MSSINGQEWQLANSSWVVVADKGTLPLDSFRAFNYKDGAKKKVVQNHQGKNVGWTIGEQATEGSLTLLKSEWEQVKAWLKARYAPLGVGQILLVASVTYGNSPATRITEKVTFMFDEDPRKADKNQEAIEVELPLFVMKVEDSDGVGFINYNALQ